MPKIVSGWVSFKKHEHNAVSSVDEEYALEVICTCFFVLFFCVFLCLPFILVFVVDALSHFASHW